MPEPRVDIEAIVREVLAVLNGAAHSSANASPAPNGAMVGGSDDAGRGGRPAVRIENGHASGDLFGSTPAAAQSARGDLVITARVVTLAALGEQLAGARRLVLAPGAIVTPAVRDELKRRGVALVHRSQAGNSTTAELRLAARVLGKAADPAAVGAALAREPVHVDCRKADCLIAATDELARELKQPDTLAFVLTAHPATALCLANRHPGVRAVWATTAERLERDLADVGANLLVIDPRATAPFPLRQMLRDFCRRGVADCPEALRKPLCVQGRGVPHADR